MKRILTNLKMVFHIYQAVRTEKPYHIQRVNENIIANELTAREVAEVGKFYKYANPTLFFSDDTGATFYFNDRI